MTARPPSVTQCICSLGCWGASWWPPCSDSDTRSCCKHPRAGFRAAMNVQLLRRMPKTATAGTYVIVMFCSREEAASFLNPQTATHVRDENVLSKVQTYFGDSVSRVGSGKRDDGYGRTSSPQTSCLPSGEAAVSTFVRHAACEAHRCLSTLKESHTRQTPSKFHVNISHIFVTFPCVRVSSVI